MRCKCFSFLGAHTHRNAMKHSILHFVGAKRRDMYRYEESSGLQLYVQFHLDPNPSDLHRHTEVVTVSIFNQHSVFNFTYWYYALIKCNIY